MIINLMKQNKVNFKRIYGTSSTIANSVRFDSRYVTKHDVFVCIQGDNHDGHAFIEDSIAQGASIIVGTNEDLLKSYYRQFEDCTFLVVEDARLAMAQLAVLLSDEAWTKLVTVAVTGTNGKTTVAAYVRSLLNQLQLRTTSIGTCGIVTSKEKLDFFKSTPTTPESADLHALFKLLESEGEKAVVMEATSIALDQKRTAAMTFDVAIHTNLSPEHLEYHETMDNYKQAKMKLFEQAATAIVNIDDEGMAQDILDTFHGKLLTYSLKKNSEADLIASNLQTDAHGIQFELYTNGKTYTIRAPIYGAYNVSNLLAAVGTAMHLGYDLESIVDVLVTMENPEGRFEVIEQYGSRKIILDYAHTPAALDQLLTAVNAIPHRRLIVMILGVGIRDFGKMPKMAQTIEGRADEIVVSVDHPGHHDPKNIIDAVCKGFSDRVQNVSTAQTRAKAVCLALDLSREGDIVLLTGGQINGAQFVRGKAIPHSDHAIIQSYFEEQNAEKVQSTIS
ncbi:UDP-N-acetylmuramoyl-L-alanyl-D-glutamate--2,6-diaminopimelate ligase [Terribacillus saccharophilus]|uniref:UDP-N-acetylmuramoyl-L-alanyl-D-glutamate--2, 6-diaminopimelate ligase n=1 Tax=Terribacillus saccharophilus TaxID=361277 RepID=A0A268AB33_9BACI|nr:UDP-N-acetylmuramoyl-L-alanyl-D-glutamate--2,6-diaminopimelate ligase [Terribacillus saccharophilus]PAD21335.1 UDP-N-acetylmuramoyl-L-alanyl-D-glutamate--2,6-diaminopimelate ligase [Terribacillus saccharophilus]